MDYFDCIGAACEFLTIALVPVVIRSDQRTHLIGVRAEPDWRFAVAAGFLIILWVMFLDGSNIVGFNSCKEFAIVEP